MFTIFDVLGDDVVRYDFQSFYSLQLFSNFFIILKYYCYTKPESYSPVTILLHEGRTNKRTTQLKLIL